MIISIYISFRYRLNCLLSFFHNFDSIFFWTGLTLNSLSFWYHTSSSSGLISGWVSMLRSSLERERIFRRDTISPDVEGPQLKLETRQNTLESFEVGYKVCVDACEPQKISGAKVIGFATMLIFIAKEKPTINWFRDKMAFNFQSSSFIAR